MQVEQIATKSKCVACGSIKKVSGKKKGKSENKKEPSGGSVVVSVYHFVP
jgi:hypothetical protein